MRHSGIKIFLLILFLLIIIGAVLMIIRPFDLNLPFIGREQAAASLPSATAQLPAEQPIEQQPGPEKENEAPESSPSLPSPEPTPTPTPYVPTPEPLGRVINSGTISSGKPWLINIHADWAAVTAADNQTEVTVIVYADHYALDYGSTESLRISLGEDSVLLETNDIRTDSNQPQSTELGRKTYTLPLREGETIELPLEVSWNFQGKYVDDAGHYFDVHGISCEGTVTITG